METRAWTVLAVERAQGEGKHCGNSSTLACLPQANNGKEKPLALQCSSRDKSKGVYFAPTLKSSLSYRIHSLSVIIYLKRGIFPPGSCSEDLVATDVSYNKLVPT